MKIFFSMTHPGYIRNYESTLRLLAERGHSIHLFFFFKEKLGEGRVLDRLRREYPAITCRTLKPRRSARLRLARVLRLSVDVLRYRAPRYRGASKLRARADAAVPWTLRWLFKLPIWRVAVLTRWVTKGLISLERGLPPYAGILDAVATEGPDVALVTPLVDIGSDQVEVVKCARALGLPSMLLVHSWDNLTNKGLIRIVPDRVAVWNEEQMREAVELHGVSPSRVVVTGAPSYDHWFEWKPRASREEFCRKVGLAHEKPILLYLCSSVFIAPAERPFVEDWIRRIRSCADPALREAGILIRPHPQNAAQWEAFCATGLSNVAVWPRGGRNPIDDDSRSEYFDSIFHSAAVIGVNTSAQIEAGIIGRRVFTLLAPEFESTQGGTLHFHHLLDVQGGLLSVARSFEEHFEQLGAALRAPVGDAAGNRHFLGTFIRPHGLDVAATPLLVDAIEDLPRLPRAERGEAPLAGLVARAALAPILCLLAAQAWLREFLTGGERSRAAGGIPGAVRALSGLLRRARRRWTGARPQASGEASSGAERRLLFVMLHPGYLRYYDSTLRILAKRGWRIALAFNQPDKQAEDGLIERLARDAGVSSLKSPVRAPGVSATFAKFVRNLRDYLRYADPRYAAAPLLRARMELRIQRPILALVRLLERFAPAGIRILGGLLALAERAVPSSPILESFLEERGFDLVLVTPLVNMGSQQVDWVKSARALGIRTGLCVASWDNLTNKGLVKIATDRVIVWNEIQRGEAIRFHGVRPASIVETGAPRFDEWFLERPTRDRDSLARAAGLPAGRPYVLYLCSSPFVGRSEVAFVESWIRAVRGAADPAVSRLGILIRPHPQNAAPWRDVDFSRHEGVTIWPRAGANPVLPGSRSDFFDAIWHAEAVAGLNTSAFLDAGILGVPAFTVITPETAATQEGTLHFRYLLREEGGLLHVASRLEDHVRDLARSQADRAADREHVKRFIGRFLRPRGLDVPCAPLCADAIEGILNAPPIQPRWARRFEWVWTWPLRIIFAPLALGAHAVYAASRERPRLRSSEGQEKEAVAARD